MSHSTRQCWYLCSSSDAKLSSGLAPARCTQEASNAPLLGSNGDHPRNSTCVSGVGMIGATRQLICDCRTRQSDIPRCPCLLRLKIWGST